MAEWGSGYTTDTAYVHDFCRVQIPTMLGVAALAGNVRAPGAFGEKINYCDLGCGQGYTANLVAAANPMAQVFGYDFNPAHIVNAQALAADAGLSNASFREASFDELLRDNALPAFDIMCMHGVYGWVSAENRATLVALARKALKPGGLLYVSYDCMPGWAGFAPLRRILARRFAPGPTLSSSEALEQSIAYADALRAAGAQYYRMFPHVEAQLDRLKKTPSRFLAHEILPRYWEAFSFADVAADFSEAKLDFVGPAHLSDSVDRVNFTEAQQAFLATLPDVALAQSTRDMLLARQFRRDVFVKGRVTMGDAKARAQWLETRFALTIPAADVDLTFSTALGQLQMRAETYAPLIEVLGRGPAKLRDIIEALPKPELNWISLTDAIKLLVGRGCLQPALPETHDASRLESTRRFNAALMARSGDDGELAYMASPVTGGGVRLDRLTQLFLAAQRRGVKDPLEAIVKSAKGATAMGADGKPLAPEELEAEVRRRLIRIESDVAPLLKKLGIS